MDVSILILNYNTRELTLNALQSVYESISSYSFEVILVDNASKDDSIEHIQREFPQVKLILNKENVGFAIANNQAMRISQGRYVLLLNSDTLIQQDTLAIMLQFMDKHPEVGAAGCKLVLQDGSLDKACKRGFPTPSASFYYAFGISKLFPAVPRFNQYQLGYKDPDDAYPVDCLVGAFMFVRRAAIDQVGMLDEEFFMYGEDIDWCYRIKQAGWVNYYYPKTQILHLKGASSRRKPVKIVYEFHRAMWLFHRKHYQKNYPYIVNGLVYAGIGVKLALSLVKNQIKRMR
ncbi:glycosyltransferase family 2 protein [Paenibacillus psychroresistens]|uniref:Glycosyltransferase family 2 protein n=1 Tax=Paenibacillus psychroresistens TaxID=1778678 RepID=A0A6B8RT23_9BACL|nr:glycosyltransferase family 2 protein [Paenibacillus psychroresistens]QGQ98466.1 glycosyltransferase family 2 protein [Paenibacillus psychroresistens]